MTTLSPVPEAIIQLGKCGCINSRYSSNKCNGWKAELKCTGLCIFADTGDLCDNQLDDDGDYDPEEEDMERDGHEGDSSTDR